MTKLLDKALEAVRRLPPDSQDEIARAMLALSESDDEAEPIEAAHLPAVLEGLAQARRRDSPQTLRSRRYCAASRDKASVHA